MNVKLKICLFAGVSALALTACGGGGSGGGGNPGGAVALEDQFGPSFGQLYRAGANTDPAEPTAASVPALTLIADPIAVP